MNKLTLLLVAVVGLWIFSGCGSEETVKEEKIRPVKSITIGDAGDGEGKGFPGVTKENQEILFLLHHLHHQ